MSKNKLKDPHFKHALGISGVLTQNYSWRSKKNEGGAQIDLVIDRADNCVNIVEIKFVSEPFVITADYEQKRSTR